MSLGTHRWTTAFVAAGFAPRYRETELTSPEMAPIRRAIEFILQHQEPYPAVVMNRHWDILLMNDSIRRILERLRPGGPRHANMLRQMTLAILPDYTGGRTVVNSNKPADAIARIFEEDRSYYVLGITRDPAAAGSEDRRQITVKVKRSDATVQARKVYFAADPNARRTAAPSAAAAALGELLPRADFPLQMNLVPQFSPDGSPEVRVLLGVASEVAGKLDVLIGTFDRTFNPPAAPVKQRLDVPASAVAGSSAFQWGTLLKMAPGDYEVRAAVATGDGKRAASVIGYVSVPDVNRAGFALSGVVVKSAGAPTLRRVFSAGEPISLSFQIARAKKEPASVSVRYWIHDEQRQTVASGSLPPTDGVIQNEDVAVRMPNAAGSYVATVEASDGSRSTRRDVLLTVR